MSIPSRVSIDISKQLQHFNNIHFYLAKFAHMDQPSSIDLNIVRLCFQAFIPVGSQKYYKLKPVVTEPIYDKKSINELVICRLCSCSAKASGGDTIFLLCEKLPKDDIKIRFYEEKDGKVIWEDYGEFQQTDIHKQTAIAFKTPRYHNTEIEKRAQVPESAISSDFSFCKSSFLCRFSYSLFDSPVNRLPTAKHPHSAKLAILCISNSIQIQVCVHFHGFSAS